MVPAQAQMAVSSAASQIMSTNFRRQMTNTVDTAIGRNVCHGG